MASPVKVAALGKVIVWSGPALACGGSLTGITLMTAVVDPASGLQKVKALFDNRDGKVRPGVAGRMLWN